MTTRHFRLFMLLALIMMGASNITAQTYLVNEGFEGSAFPPQGWTVIDNDHDGHTWFQGTTGFRSGSRLAVSATVVPKGDGTGEIVYPGTQDNWLILPAINVTNSAFALRLYYSALDIETAEHIIVKLSTTGKNVADFTTTLLDKTVDNGYADNNEWFLLNQSLSAYAGKQIYIAIIHQGYNSWQLGVDDVAVMNLLGPQPISGLGATTSGNKVTLTWTNPTKNGNEEQLSETDVNIYRDGVLLGTVNGAGGQAMTYTDQNAPTGLHTYSVCAKNPEGESLPRTKTVYAGEDVPAAVSNLNVSVEGGRAVLQWDAPTKGANNGQISAATMTYNVSKTVGSTTTSLTTGLTDTRYETALGFGELTSFTVTAVTGAGAGTAANSGNVVSYGQQYTEITVGKNASNEVPGRANRIPMNLWSSHGSSSQVLYTSADLMGVKGKINHVVYKSSITTSAGLTRTVRLYMLETTKTGIADGWIATTGMTKVFEGDVTLTPGQNEIPLTLNTQFDYKGGNLVVALQETYQTRVGAYFDLFFVDASDGYTGRARTMEGESFSDFTAPSANTGDVLAAVPMTRFVIEATNVAEVKGTVKSSAGQAIGGAQVAIEALGLSATTAADGSYSLPIVVAGQQTVKVTAVGYEDKTETITVPSTGTLTKDFVLTARPTTTVSGKAVAADTQTALGGARVVVSGYSETETVTAADGSFSVSGLYPGKNYDLRIEKNEYDVYRYSTQSLAKDLSLGTVTLARSLISPYAANATVAADGSSVTISWSDPLTRPGKTQWTVIGGSDQQNSSSKEYWSEDDYCVAHLWTPADIETAGMSGLSFKQLRVYLKAPQAGEFSACVWKGNVASHELLAEKVIPLSDISATGGWVTVTFDEPIEIRSGETYMAGFHAVGAPDSEVGINNTSEGKVEGRNNIRFTDKEGAYTYVGSYGYNITTLVGVPGTELDVSSPGEAPKCAYKVYRSANNGTSWTALTQLAQSQLTYTDAQWGSLASGEYLYKVQAAYTGGESIGAKTDIVERALNTDAGVSAFVSPVRSAESPLNINITVEVTNFGEKPLTSVPVTATVGSKTLSKTYSGTLNKGATARVELGSVQLETGSVYTIEARTQVPDDGNAENDALSMEYSTLENVTLKGIRFWDIAHSSGPVTIESNAPEYARLLKPVYPNEDEMICSGEHVGGTFYGYTLSAEVYYTYGGAISPASFVALDTLTWTPTVSATTEEYVYDMAYDHTSDTMYALRYVEKQPGELATVDLATGALTTVGALTEELHALACSTDGQLYAIGEGGTLYRLSKTDAAATEVGETGVTDVRYLQSMTFDHKSGRLFWSQTGDETYGCIYEINPQTAAATRFGDVQWDGNPSQIVGLYTAFQPDMAGIQAVPAASPAETEPLYDLSGRRVAAGASLPRGVYIRGGRKVLK